MLKYRPYHLLISISQNKTLLKYFCQWELNVCHFLQENFKFQISLNAGIEDWVVLSASFLFISYNITFKFQDSGRDSIFRYHKAF